jgi:mutator protein MutT
VIDVAAALVFAYGRLLITRRPPGKSLAGLWEFPGGKLEPGESWESALARELIEELDLVVQVGVLYEEITHHYPDKSIRLRFYRCTPQPGSSPRPIECSELLWVSRPDLKSHSFPAADARLLDRLEADPSVWA